MKIDSDTSNLDWNKASINDYRYIHHLMQMAWERWKKLGSIDWSQFNRYVPFKFNRYSPFGILTWDQLSSIYHAMTYLGTYVFLNPKNLNAKYWKNGDNRKWAFYSLQDMCDIAEFDFFAHPFIPGQPLDYYSKFLLPIKKVLASYKTIAISRFLTKNNTILLAPSGKTGMFPLPTFTYTSESGTSFIYEINGSERISYLRDEDNWKKYLRRYYNQLKNDETLTNFEGQKVNPTYNKLYGLGYQYAVYTLYSLYNKTGKYENGRMDHGLCYSYVMANFGSWYRSLTKYIPGLPYKVYLLHTTNSGSHYNTGQYDYGWPSYFDSPWDNLIELRSGNVNENGDILEYIELPEIDIPMTTSKSTVDEYYSEKLKKGQYSTEVVDRKWGAARTERFSAFYVPLIVIDYSSYFQYN
jgi:hypothetical protein